MKRPSPQRLRRYWDTHADRYDAPMTFFDRHLFGDSREWICSRATGRVLEVAIGTGLNLPHYPEDIQLTGLEFSPAMMGHARRRATELGRDVDQLVTVPYAEEHFRRRPIRHVQALGLWVEAHDRFKLGIVERLAARKP